MSDVEFEHLTDDGSDDKPHHNQVYFYVAYKCYYVFLLSKVDAIKHVTNLAHTEISEQKGNCIYRGKLMIKI